MVAAAAVSRGHVVFVHLNPTRDSETRKTRAGAVVSPDELHAHLRTFIVAPLTTGRHPYTFRVPCRSRGRGGFVVLDQLRAIDQARISRPLGRITPATMSRVLHVPQEMFAS